MKLSDSEMRLFEKLHKGEHFVEHISNNGPDIIYVLDLKQNKYTYTNKRVEELMSPENILLDKIHPQDYERRNLHINQCMDLEKSETLDIDLRLKVKNDEWHWFRVRDIPFRFDEDGRVTHTIGVAREVHEHKSWEEILSKKEELLNKILNAQSIALVVYKAIRNMNYEILDYEFVMVSRTFEEFHKRTDLVGKWVFEEFPMIKQYEYEKWKRVVEKNEIIKEKNSFRDPKTGRIHWFQLQFEKMDDGLMVVWEDITEKRENKNKIMEQVNA
jgi:PAS domain-containing protein